MKKNVSINIGGIIFHVEEDGYEKLKNYLDTINSYFADFQESQEIITDIENRIAEIFLSKLKDDKQVINLEDVEALIATLGSIEDFKKAEKESEPGQEEYTTEEKEFYETEGSKKLFRDTKRKILGGVAAGLAHYFKVDVLWIRLVLILLGALTFWNGVGLIVVVAYILSWIFLPADPFLPETEKVKKLYRGKDGVVIAGVAKGLAIYLGVEVAIIRLLFVLLLIPGFAGFFIYLVLWLITPKANSLTEKMQMEGTPITLSNIEKSIKSNFKDKDGEESVWAKILLFPFRLIAIILTGLAKVLGPILNVVVDIIRVIVGLVFIVLGLSFATSAFSLVLFNEGWLIPERFMRELDAPLHIFANTVSVEQNIVIFLLLAIPAVFITIAGISVLAKKWVLNKTFGFSLLGLYIVSLIVAGFMIFNTAMNFNKKGVLTETTEFNLNGKETLVLDVRQIGYDDYDEPSLTIFGYDGNTIKLEQNFDARGFSRENAIENAGMIIHEVIQKDDSILVFDSDLRFKENAIFRAQDLEMNLYIPFNQKFEMDNSLRDILRNTIYRNGYSAYQIPNNTWVFTEEGLECLTCEENTFDKSNSNDNTLNNDYSYNGDFYKAPFSIDDAYIRRYGNSNFSKLNIATGIFVEVSEGSNYSITVYSEEDDFENLGLEQSGSTLKMYQEHNGFWDGDNHKIKAVITMPNIDVISASSAATVHLFGFEEESFDIDISSAAKVYAEGRYKNLDVDASSAASAYLKGSAEKLEAKASSSASIRAFELSSNTIDADASSAARIEVNPVRTLNADASSAGRVRYKGNANVNANSGSGGRVSRD
jgi:phage shock protein PspC (stress-responsive transcriptional regulator)